MGPHTIIAIPTTEPKKVFVHELRHKLESIGKSVIQHCTSMLFRLWNAMGCNECIAFWLFYVVFVVVGFGCCALVLVYLGRDITMVS